MYKGYSYTWKNKSRVGPGWLKIHLCKNKNKKNRNGLCWHVEVDLNKGEVRQGVRIRMEKEYGETEKTTEQLITKRLGCNK